MKLPSAIWCCAVYLATCTLCHSRGTEVKSPSVYNGLWRRDFEENAIKAQDYRRTRTISVAAKAITGMAAVRTLLKHARKVPSEKPIYRQYVKYGNYETAITDFYSIKPKNVRDLTGGFFIDFSQGRRILGVAGDRRVRLLIHGDKLSQGKPVIEIFDDKRPSGAYIDRVVYRTDEH